MFKIESIPRVCVCIAEAEVKGYSLFSGEKVKS